MGRVIVVVGPHEIEFNPVLRMRAQDRIHQWFAHQKNRKALVLGRLATPVESWAHHIGRDCGLHVEDYRLDGEKWSSLTGQDTYSSGGASLDLATWMVAQSVTFHICRLKWAALLIRLEVPGMPLVDPLLPMLACLPMHVAREDLSVPLPSHYAPVMP